MPVVSPVVFNIASFIPLANAVMCHSDPLFIFFLLPSCSRTLDKLLEREAFNQRCLFTNVQTKYQLSRWDSKVQDSV